MQQDVPKQFLPVDGRPVLMHTLVAFHHPDIRIVVVLPEAEATTWQQLCRQYHFSVPHKVVAGGATRSASVYRGLLGIDDEEGLVAVHDGVRPLVSPELISSTYQQAERYGSAVAAVPLKDSIRQMRGEQNTACPRDEYRLMQTPQTFRLSGLRKAYDKAMKEGKEFSDDASVWEYDGNLVHLATGEYRNLKVTTPEDLIVAEALLRQNATGQNAARQASTQ